MFSSQFLEDNFRNFSGSESQTSPIGIFDSGVGGLTVLREVYFQLPQESVIYFGDTAHLPYGMRSQREILQFVRQILTWMQQQKVKMAIMACNTSSALALETVRSEFPFPILGIILPGAKAAVEKGRRIGVIATLPTAKSNAYRNAIVEIDPEIQVWQVSCPELVPLIEENRIYDPYTTEITRSYIEPLLNNQIDTLVYGCTHYPHLAPVLRTLLPDKVKLVDPAAHLVRACGQELDLLKIKNTLTAQPTRFAVSGCPQQFAQSCLQLLGYTPNVEVVDLNNISVCDLRQDITS
ncbi:glutamate racemase [Mastigocoleus testarum]|uniref:Glutamate racemase n=1 Tax=Mastigocoleus testarum BC008 TaxID=371196 RepID=A0A0V7ZKA8_9CYAN|nr:glutamate racemase [Mastigocoleus testarum]KST64882.1 glutamate racemase [Mastigocoleus testarum BC008]KST67037.1 glutamate racemase [Mastigocoleus testarum BC008]